MRKGLFLLTALLVAGSSVTAHSFAAVVNPFSAKIILPGDPEKAAAKAAVEEFSKLSKKGKKERLKEARKELKVFKAKKSAGEETDTNTILLAILAILLPPLAVYLYEGETDNKFWITLLLFVLGLFASFLFSWFFYLAAIVYALIVILGGQH
jgi:uncharacterized membrane protein YqaE (UPF0057 family)